MSRTGTEPLLPPWSDQTRVRAFRHVFQEWKEDQQIFKKIGTFLHVFGHLSERKGRGGYLILKMMWNFFLSFGLHIFQEKFGRMTKIQEHQQQKVQL